MSFRYLWVPQIIDAIFCEFNHLSWKSVHSTCLFSSLFFLSLIPMSGAPGPYSQSHCSTHLSYLCWAVVNCPLSFISGFSKLRSRDDFAKVALNKLAEQISNLGIWVSNLFSEFPICGWIHILAKSGCCSNRYKMITVAGEWQNSEKGWIWHQWARRLAETQPYHTEETVEMCSGAWEWD